MINWFILEINRIKVVMLTGFRFSLISIVFHWFVIIDSYIWKFFVLFLTHHTIYKIFTIKFTFGDQWEKVERTDPFHFLQKCEKANGRVIFQISGKNEYSEISLKVFQIFRKIPIGKAHSIWFSIRKSNFSIQMESISDDCYLL